MPNLFRHLTCKVADRYGFEPADGVLKQVQHDLYFVQPVVGVITAPLFNPGS